MSIALNLAIRKGFWPPFGVQLLHLELVWQNHVQAEEKQKFVSAFIQGYERGLKRLGFEFLLEPQRPFGAQKDAAWIILLPFHEFCEPACVHLLRAVFKRLNAQGGVSSEAEDLLPENVYRAIEKKYFARKNPKRLAQNLIARRIPLVPRGNEIMQIGWGHHARLLHSSVSEQTAQIGITIAGNKKLCADILRLHGLPAGNAVPCKTEAAALAAAQRMGFPVVVKPADQERGVGVFALIDDEARLRAAFAKAQEISNNILIEKHFFGKDYRIQIYNGQAYSITYREPGSVTGNGIDTIGQLLDQLNQARATDPMLRPIALDDDARYMLKRQGLSLGSVPAEGQHVALRSIANVDRGGISTQVLDLAHPDNIALAARAAEVVNLDIAGIDLLIEDISRSWKDVGALICEVNARPMVNQPALGRLVDLMAPAQGYRPPALLVVAPISGHQLVEALADLKLGIGVAGDDGAWVDALQIQNGKGLTQNGRALLLNRDVRLIIHCAAPHQLVEDGFGGFACDHYDHLLLDWGGDGRAETAPSAYVPSGFGAALPRMANGIIAIDGLDGDPQGRVLAAIRSWACDQAVMP